MSTAILNGIKATTIGFTKTTAEHFFARLHEAGVKRVIDVRLHNTSQLAGFAKADDLSYFLRSIGSIAYEHAPLLAPTDAILTAFKKEKGDWALYEKQFLALMAERRIEARLDPEHFQDACLLCSEDLPHHCHRRLVCDYLNDRWGGVLQVQHL